MGFSALGIVVDEDPDHLARSTAFPRQHENLRTVLEGMLTSLTYPRAAARSVA